jgi:hypothetical protein
MHGGGTLTKMAWQTLDQYNATDVGGLFTYAAQIVPIFTPLMLTSIFIITLLGTYFSQKRLSGRSDFLSSFAVAGWLTFVVAILMSLIGGLINMLTLVFCMIIAIISSLMLILNNND